MRSSTSISIDEAQERLKELLEEMPAGETLTVVDPDGDPMALLTSLKSSPITPLSPEEWEARWRALAEQIDKAWKSDKSAVEVISEMRR